jgi:glycosyltransferase involved in cell wall biosynthesis
MVISEMRPGGAERVVVHLTGTLAARGVELLVVCLQNEGPLAEELKSRGVRVVALKSLRGYDIPAVVRLARVLRQFRPDVINVHDRSSLPYVVLANRIAGRRPVVFSAYGLLFQAMGKARWLNRWSMRHVAAMTAVSAETAQEYAQQLGWPETVTVIPTGVPTFSPNPGDRKKVRGELGLTDDAFVFLAVGSVKPEKGFEDLIEACALLRSRGAESLKVLIAGGAADEAYAASLRRLVAERAVQDSVCLLGFWSDLCALYAAADAFVLSSRKEGLPTVLLEAMAAGLPVAATRVGGVPSVVRHETNGLLVQAAAPGDLAEAMSRLLADAPLRSRLGREGRETVQQEYGLERMARNYFQVYTDAVGCSSSSSRSHSHADPNAAPSVLMLGPLPPLTGGMVSVTENLRFSNLARRCRLHVINNGKTTPERRSFLEGAAAQLRLLGQLVRHILSQSPRVVHIHTSQFFGFWRDCVHLLAAAGLGRHTVLHMHGASFDRWAAEMGPLRRPLMRAALEMASTVIVLSEDWLTKLRPYAPRARWNVVPNGVAIPDSIHTNQSAQPVFLFLGDWTPRKGVRDLVSATAVAARHGFPGIVCLAGFEKKPGQREALDRHIAESGCKDKVRILGVLACKEKEAALAASDCLVLPSYAEGLPMAILEAMAYGLPVIATRVGAIPEVVTDGREGLLVEPGDIPALATCLAKLASDAALRVRMGQAARQRAQTEYSLDKMVDSIRHIYLAVIGTREGTDPSESRRS